MPLSVAVRRSLAFGLKSQSVANEIVTVVDAGTGTLSGAAKTRLQYACTDRVLGAAVWTKINSSAALSGREQDVMGRIMNSRPLAKELADALAAA